MAVAATQHIDEIFALVAGETRPPPDAVIGNSWIRCATSLRIDPATRQSPRILTLDEMKVSREASQQLIEVAQPELDHLYKIVRPAKYVILLCDKDGLVIEHRGEESEAQQFRKWGTWVGGVWSEEAEGTNGIGTCLAEQRPVTVHQSQHFRARHITLSCSGAPIFDGNCELLGVLDVSSIDPELSEHAHALTGALTIAAARATEERLFRNQFRRHWIFAVGPSDDLSAAMLFSVDQDRRIVGADRNARRVLSRSGHDHLAQAVGLWTIFQHNEALFRHKDRGDLSGEVRLRDVAESWPAIVTPPEPVSLRWSQFQNEELRLRPRLDALTSGRGVPAPQKPRGGLAPSTLRRIRDYVDSHLGESIDLKALATTAELSLYHFARSFKQSEGTTPHDFILERRLTKARELLGQRDLSLAEIAFAVGFADQSHFTRRFRQMVGVSPGQFRKLEN